MNNPKWGTKRQCQECGARFYDLKRPKGVCPKCDAPFKLMPKVKRAIATPGKVKRAISTLDKVKAPALSDEAPTKPDAVAESAEDKPLKEVNVDTSDGGGVGPDDDDEKNKDENSFEDASELGEDKDDMAEVIDGSRKVDES